MLFKQEEHSSVVDLKKTCAHSGGAKGSDLYWGECGKKYGLFKIKHYSYKTTYHNSPNKVEISEEDYNEGVKIVNEANDVFLKRKNIEKYMNLLARNWPQVKYSESIYAIGTILNKGDTGSKGKKHSLDIPIVDGGTGYAVAFGYLLNKPIHVFDQLKNYWFKFDHYTKNYHQISIPHIITENFTAIGTRELKQNGMKAIEDVYKQTVFKHDQEHKKLH